MRELAVAGADAVLPTHRLALRIRRLEVGILENAELALPLAEQVSRLESDLVPLLERRVALHCDGRSGDGGTRG